MSQKPLYLLGAGKLKREANSLTWRKKDGSIKRIPVEQTDTIYCLGPTVINTALCQFLSQKQIVLHVFGYKGWYTGTFYPREKLCSEQLLVKQVLATQQPDQQLSIARSFVSGALHNIRQNLHNYNTGGKYRATINEINHIQNALGDSNSIPELMGLEGNARKKYYSLFSEILGEEWALHKRVYHPPDNPINALISYANSLVYTSVLSQIYHTHLNPFIGFLHSASRRGRFSLALDIAEIFKPLYADRVIFKLIKNNMFSKKDFETKINACSLTEEGRKKVVVEFENTLQTTFKHPKLGRSVSYRRLIRLECWKLEKFLVEGKSYKPFKARW
jgi:CRISP-associated protein Cas1